MTKVLKRPLDPTRKCKICGEHLGVRIDNEVDSCPHCLAPISRNGLCNATWCSTCGCRPGHGTCESTVAS
jgi:hypothetical protein